MFSPVHHDLEGLAAERLRTLAGQIRRLQEGAASAAKRSVFDLMRNLRFVRT